MTSHLSTMVLAAALALALMQMTALASRPYHDDAGIIAVPAAIGRPIFVQLDYLPCLTDPKARFYEDGSAKCDAMV